MSWSSMLPLDIDLFALILSCSAVQVWYRWIRHVSQNKMYLRFSHKSVNVSTDINRNLQTSAHQSVHSYSDVHASLGTN